MKRLLFTALALCLMVPAAYSGNTDTTGSTDEAGTTEVRWLTIAELETAMAKEPRNVWIDFYTSWCGWCKVMDRKTYANPNVAQYLNEHFYVLRVDAEQKEPITYKGKQYVYLPEQKAHQFAVEMMRGQMTFPTSVYMENGSGQPMAIPGYQDVAHMEMILKYLSEGIYKKTPYPEYEKSFKPSWN